MVVGGSGADGAGHFGEWITDHNGLPAYRYTGHADPTSLPPGHAPTSPVLAHQVPNYPVYHAHDHHRLATIV